MAQNNNNHKSSNAKSSNQLHISQQQLPIEQSLNSMDRVIQFSEDGSVALGSVMDLQHNNSQSQLFSPQKLVDNKFSGKSAANNSRIRDNNNEDFSPVNEANREKEESKDGEEDNNKMDNISNLDEIPNDTAQNLKGKQKQNKQSSKQAQQANAQGKQQQQQQQQAGNQEQQSSIQVSDSWSGQNQNAIPGKNIKDCVLWTMVCLLGCGLMAIFYLFVIGLIEQARQIDEPHYELLSYTKDSEGITAVATCIRCSEYYLQTDNPIAQTLVVKISYLNYHQLGINIAPMNNTEWAMPEASPFPFFNHTAQKQSLTDDDMDYIGFIGSEQGHGKDDQQHISKILKHNKVEAFGESKRGYEKEEQQNNTYQQQQQQDSQSTFSSTESKQLNDIIRNYVVQIKQKPLQIRVYRSSSDELILSLSSLQLLYSQFYKQFTLSLPTQQIYGLGEKATFNVDNNTNTLWTRRSSLVTNSSQQQPPLNSFYQPQDLLHKELHIHNYEDDDISYRDRFQEMDQADPHQESSTSSQSSSTNSFHPVILLRESSNAFSVLYLRTSSALESQLNQKSLTFKLVTGAIDLVMFLGDRTAQTAVKDFHAYLGGYSIPPLWSMGVQYKLKGMSNIQEISHIKQILSQSKIRLDSIWLDCSIYQDFKSFRFDKAKHNLTAFQILTQKMQLVMEVQSGIKIDEDSQAYTIGAQRDVFLKRNKDGKKELIFGKNSYKQSVHFPDYFHSYIQDFTDDIYSILYSDIPFSGVYFPDNEITDYSSQQKYTVNPVTEARFNHTNTTSTEYYFNSANSTFLPFVPGNISLSYHSIDINAIHEGNLAELGVHNLFSIMQVNTGYQYMRKQAKQKMPFLISRSTSPGFGEFGGHLAELSDCSWSSLRQSLQMIFSFNLFGIPSVGFSICPQIEEVISVEEELIGRWMQLSVFYQFYIIESQASRPSQLLLDPRFLKYYMKSLSTRQLISKYIYTVFFQLKGQGAVIKPVFFDYPFDEQLIDQSPFISEQFLIGSNLMIAPVLTPNTNVIYPYFPQDNWFNFFTGEIVKTSRDLPSISQINCPLDGDIPMFVKGGSIIPLSRADTDDWTKPIWEQEQIYDLLVAFEDNFNDDTLSASGQMIGKTIFSEANIYEACVKENCLFNIVFTAQQVVQETTPSSPASGDSIDQKVQYAIKASFNTVVPFIQVDVVRIKTIVFFLAGKKISYEASLAFSSKIDFNFQITI